MNTVMSILNAVSWVGGLCAFGLTAWALFETACDKIAERRDRKP